MCLNPSQGLIKMGGSVIVCLCSKMKNINLQSANHSNVFCEIHVFLTSPI